MSGNSSTMPQKRAKIGRQTDEFKAHVGKGRPKGVKNKTTLAMKEAITHVYNDLQADTGSDHGHFKAWAEKNQTEFYKIATKLIPQDVNANLTGSIGLLPAKIDDLA